MSRLAVVLLALLAACGSSASTGPSTPPNASAFVSNTTTDALRLTWSLSQDVVQPAKTTPINGSSTIGSHQQQCILLTLPSVDGSTGYYELHLLDESFSSPVLVGALDITPGATFATPSGYPLYSVWTFSGVGNYGGFLYLQPTLTSSLCR